MSFVVFMTHDGYIPQDAVFARGIRKSAGIESVAVVHGRRNYLMAEREAAFDKIVDLTKGYDLSKVEESLPRNLSKLAEIERKTNGPTIMQDVFQDRWLIGRFDRARIVAYLAHAAGTLEEVLSGSCIAVIGEMAMAVYRLARRLALGRAPYLFPITARFFPRFYFEDSPYMEWQRCCEAYHHFMRDGVPSRLLGVVKPVLDAIIEHNAAPAMFAHLKPNPGAGSEPIMVKLRGDRLAENLYYWRYDFLEASYNPRVTPVWEMLPHAKLLRWAKEWSVIHWFRKHVIDVPPRDKHFCTYFLHYQPEYTVEGIGYPYANQVTLIRTIAQSLPANFLLMVKEQPFMLGLRSRSYYEELMSLPNVKLVNDKANSRELIRNSEIVFTISGTAAMEAMFYGVPAIVFSPVFHSEFNGITLVRDLYNLPEVVRTLLTRGREDYSKSAVSALAAIYTSSYPGELVNLMTSNAHTFRPENVEKLASALRSELLFRRGDFQFKSFQKENCK